MDEPGRYNVMWNQPDKERKKAACPIHVWNLKKSNTQRRGVGVVSRRELRVRGNRVTVVGMNKSADLMPSVMTGGNDPVLNTGHLINMCKDYVP